MSDYDRQAAEAYRLAQGNTMIHLTRALLLRLHYYATEEELDADTRLNLLEGKWPGGKGALMERLRADFPHYFDGTAVRPILERNAV